MIPDRVWIALRQTAYVCALALGFGIGFAMCCGCAPTWRQAARMSEAAAVTSLACDGGSTEQYLADSQWIETNPVLGEHPSHMLLWSYLAAVGAAVVGANRIVPDKAALAINLVVLAFEVKSIAVNTSVGASPCGIGHGGPWQPITETRQ